MEANEVAGIFHSTEAFPDSTRRIIRQELLDYTASVCNDELKRMEQGEVSLHYGGAMPKLLTAFYQMDNKSILRSSFLLIDLYIPREAPFRDDAER